VKNTVNTLYEVVGNMEFVVICLVVGYICGVKEFFGDLFMW